MTGPVAEGWSVWEYPALVAIHQEFEAQPYGSIISSPAVLQRLNPSGADEDRWGGAIDRLDRSGYLESRRTMWGRPYPMHIIRLTERGLRAVGAWPRDVDPLQILVQVLVAQADAVEQTEPERASRLRIFAEAVGKGMLDVGTDFAAKFAAKAAGLE